MKDDRPSLDRIFALLADRRRRYAIYYLDEAETAVATLDDLVDQLANWERKWDGRGDVREDDLRERIRVELHHNHLPRLAEVGLIDYDDRTRTVRDWEEPSLREWAKNDRDELPRLRAVFTSA